LGWKRRVSWHKMFEPSPTSDRYDETFRPGTPVWMRDVISNTWSKGSVLTQKGRRIVSVQLESGRVRDVHFDHVRPRSKDEPVITEQPQGNWRRMLWTLNLPSTPLASEAPQPAGRALNEQPAFSRRTSAGANQPVHQAPPAIHSKPKSATLPAARITNRPKRDVRAPLRYQT